MRRPSRKQTQQQRDSGSATPDDLDEKDNISDLAWWAYQAIKWIGAILFIFFGWLQVRFLPVLSYVQNTPPEALIKGTLIAYYASWIGGCTFDTWIQQKVYVSDPKQGEVTVSLIGAIFAMFIVAFVLVWASSHQQFFALILLGFTIVNIVGWWLIVARIKPIIAASRAKLLSGERFFRLEQLRVIEAHMTGAWQRSRFVAMVLISLLGVLVYYSSPVRLFIARFIEASPLGIASNTAADLLPPIIYLSFVLVAEAWIWVKRENVRAMLLAMDKLRKGYFLRPIPERN
jgi:hypothetical protein